jgi:hypothetical protein
MSVKFKLAYILILLGFCLLPLKNVYADSYAPYQLPLTLQIQNNTDRHLTFQYSQLSTTSSTGQNIPTLENQSPSSSIQCDNKAVIYSYVPGENQSFHDFAYSSFTYTVQNVILYYFDENNNKVGCQYSYMCKTPAYVTYSNPEQYDCSQLQILTAAPLETSNSTWLSQVNCMGGYSTGANTATITITQSGGSSCDLGTQGSEGKRK